jgi:hypothetical protein
LAWRRSDTPAARVLVYDDPFDSYRPGLTGHGRFNFSGCHQQIEARRAVEGKLALAASLLRTRLGFDLVEVLGYQLRTYPEALLLEVFSRSSSISSRNSFGSVR